jgi:hypothetical protein
MKGKKMITLVKHGNNEIELSNGLVPCESIFFAYSTAVAGLDDKGFYKTDKFFSKTTSEALSTLGLPKIKLLKIAVSLNMRNLLNK